MVQKVGNKDHVAFHNQNWLEMIDILILIPVMIIHNFVVGMVYKYQEDNPLAGCCYFSICSLHRSLICHNISFEWTKNEFETFVYCSKSNLNRSIGL